MRGVRPAHVKQGGVQRVFRAAVHDAPFVGRDDLRLFARDEARPHRHRLGPERQGRCHAPAVGNAARGDHGHGSHRFDRGRHDGGQRGRALHVAAGLHPLGDDPIDAGIRGGHGLVHASDLQEHRGPAAMRVADVRRNVAPEEHEQRYALGQTCLDLAFLKQRQNDVHPERPAGQAAQRTDLFADDGRGHAAHAQYAAAARLADRRGQCRAGHAAAHADREDRVADVEPLAHRRAQRVPSAFRSGFPAHARLSTWR